MRAQSIEQIHYWRLHHVLKTDRYTTLWKIQHLSLSTRASLVYCSVLYLHVNVGKQADCSSTRQRARNTPKWVAIRWNQWSVQFRPQLLPWPPVMYFPPSPLHGRQLSPQCPAHVLQRGKDHPRGARKRNPGGGGKLGVKDGDNITATTTTTATSTEATLNDWLII